MITQKLFFVHYYQTFSCHRKQYYNLFWLTTFAFNLHNYYRNKYDFIEQLFGQAKGALPDSWATKLK